MKNATIHLHAPDWGQVTVTGWAMTATIANYLPASHAYLQQQISERADIPIEQLRTLDLASLLIILADMDHNAADDPLSVDWSPA